MKRNQSGFSIFEMLIVLGLLSAVAYSLTLVFSGDSSKARLIVAQFNMLATANEAARNDSRCYISIPRGLRDAAEGGAPSGNFCGKDVTARLVNNPYLDGAVYNSAGLIELPKVSDEKVVFSFRRVGTGTPNEYHYFIEATNVPARVAERLVPECTISGNQYDTAANHAPSDSELQTKFFGQKCLTSTDIATQDPDSYTTVFFLINTLKSL